MISLRLLTLVVTTCLGGFMFGYDTGFIGAATTMESFQHDFGITEDNKAELSGNVVATLQAGCFFGVIIMAFLTDKLGRRPALMISGAVFDVGAVLQTAAKGHVGILYAGRVISGLGVGAASMLAPTFIAEMSPKKIRGALTMTFGFSIFLSIAISYWVDYACQQRLSGSNQYLVPIGLQLVPGTVLVLGMIPLVESPRFLVKKGKRDKAYDALMYIRKNDQPDEETIEEFAEIVDSVEKELAETEGVTIKEIFMKHNLKRFAIAIIIMIAQQTSGTNAFTYYAPVFFEFVGLHGTSTGLFATGVYGIVKCVATIISIFFMIERIGRRKLMVFGGFGMGSVMLIIGCIYATMPPPTGDNISAASYAMVVMIYVYCVHYGATWGPVPFTYVSEIFPNRIREYGVTSALATQWAFNYCISRVVPIGIENIKWKMFIIFAIFNYCNVVFCFFYVKETKGMSLEDIDAMLGSPTAINVKDSHERAQGILANLDDVKDPENHHVERVNSRDSAV